MLHYLNMYVFILNLKNSMKIVIYYFDSLYFFSSSSVLSNCSIEFTNKSNDLFWLETGCIGNNTFSCCCSCPTFKSSCGVSSLVEGVLKTKAFVSGLCVPIDVNIGAEFEL